MVLVARRCLARCRPTRKNVKMGRNVRQGFGVYHARMARRAQHLRCERSERADNRLDNFGVRGRKVNSRDCALASDLVRASP